MIANNEQMFGPKAVFYVMVAGIRGPDDPERYRNLDQTRSLFNSVGSRSNLRRASKYISPAHLRDGVIDHVNRIESEPYRRVVALRRLFDAGYRWTVERFQGGKAFGSLPFEGIFHRSDFGL